MNPETLNKHVSLLPGDPIDRYGPYVNLTFVEETNGHVIMKDKHENEKTVYLSLFVKHAEYQPSYKFYQYES